MTRALNNEANAVLQEFGGILPEQYLSFEDVKREYLNTRALELQKIGLASTNRTVIESEMDVEARDGSVVFDEDLRGLTPAAVEYCPDNQTQRFKVTIVNVDDIPNYEGNRAIAFYGDPLRYRLSFNSWETGTLYLFYDPIEDLNDLEGTSELQFPLAFWTLLQKKTAFNLIDIIRLKLLWTSEDKEFRESVLLALKGLEAKLGLQLVEWEAQIKKWINRDLRQGPTVRRSNLEIMARRYNDPGNVEYDAFE